MCILTMVISLRGPISNSFYDGWSPQNKMGLDNCTAVVCTHKLKWSEIQQIFLSSGFELQAFFLVKSAAPVANKNVQDT